MTDHPDRWRPEARDHLRALDLADAVADADQSATDEAIAAAITDGGADGLARLIRAYVATVKPPRKALVAMLRTRTERAEFDAITEEMNR
ncbi:MAG: hypothetical protein QM658_10970 [Gordonia sp. (in: high G+C Gram-positive bacteria)]